MSKNPPNGGKSKIGIRAKVLLEVMLIFALCLGALTFLNSRYLEKIYIWNQRNALSDIASSADEAAAGAYETLFSEAERSNNADIRVYDPEGILLYSSDAKFVSAQSKIEVVSSDEREDGSYFNVLRESGQTNVQYIVYGKTLKSGNLIEIYTQKNIIEESASISVGFTAALSLFGLLAAFVFVSIYASRLTDPLVDMNRVTQKMAAMDFSQKCKVGSRDEIGSLARGINELSDSLDRTLRDLNDKNEQLLKDIERERELDRIRKEFIAAVSHELKTPISIIQGYAEGVKLMTDGGNVQAAEYCDVIMNEAARMNGLVMQLLEISMYESGAYTLREGDFNISEAVSSYLTGAAAIFAEKGISVECDIPEDFVGRGDRDKLMMIVNNYVSNAVSHSAGEKKIRISASDTGEKYRISVFNTGEHIADEDMERIWISFYRADRSHSRDEGRFGLGLSIVRAVAEMHGCECGCENTDGGVIFWFDISRQDTDKKNEENI
ncbi:MAG: HAMP domain-containing histidine kinase [Clostridiales bacterium]|nr:HAMP domain-containing histidine kinase [Clostridiales bacterium]